MHHLIGLATFVCATLLTSSPVALPPPSQNGSWQMHCEAVGSGCVVSRLQQTARAAGPRWAKFSFAFEDQALTLRLRTREVFVPWIRLTLRPRSQVLPVRAYRCVGHDCEYVFSVSPRTLANISSFETFTLTTINTWGGEDSLNVPVDHLGELLGHLPRDL